MDIDLSKYTTKKSKVATQSQALAEEIYLESGKQIKFPLLMGLIKQQGNQAIRELWNETRDPKVNDRIKLFLWKVKNNKIQFNELR